MKTGASSFPNATQQLRTTSTMQVEMQMGKVATSRYGGISRLTCPDFGIGVPLGGERVGMVVP
jgi:hypothetical protein